MKMTERRCFGLGEKPRVALEQQLRAHAIELYPLLSNPAVYEFDDTPMPHCYAALYERFEKLESRRSPDGAEQWLNWVVRVDEEHAAGFVQATIYQDHTANIAYVLGQHYWGHGIAFEAVSQMLNALANEYAVTKLRASVDAKNIRSIRLLKRLGLQFHHTDNSGALIFMGEILPASM